MCGVFWLDDEFDDLMNDRNEMRHGSPFMHMYVFSFRNSQCSASFFYNFKIEPSRCLVSPVTSNPRFERVVVSRSICCVTFLVVVASLTFNSGLQIIIIIIITTLMKHMIHDVSSMLDSY